jgi:hypothetical protein
MLATLTVEDFAPIVGQPLALGEPAPTMSLELLSAAAARSRPAGGRTGFSLLFRGPADRPLAQGIHSIQHPALGMLDIFLVPVGPDAHGLQYEAIFN